VRCGTEEGFHKILAIRASINKGLPPALKEAFPNITPSVRPSVLDSKVTDPNWLAGPVRLQPKVVFW